MTLRMCVNQMREDTEMTKLLPVVVASLFAVSAFAADPAPAPAADTTAAAPAPAKAKTKAKTAKKGSHKKHKKAGM